jgi:hypothetical protein
MLFPICHYSASGPSLLDEYTGAKVAFSLRKLRTGVSSVIRVRADKSGQPEQDFTQGGVSGGALESFVGSGNNGYVVTWYDQSGNNNHATQSTASLQAKIVDNGSLLLENGKPATDWTEDYYTLASSITNNLDHTTIVVYAPLAAGNAMNGLTNAVPATASQFNEYDFLINAGTPAGNTLIGFDDGDVRISGETRSGTQTIYDGFARLTPNTGEIYKNGVLSGSSYTSFGYQTPGWDAWGRNYTTGFGSDTKGGVQEHIMWQSDKSSDLSDIRTAVNDYYGTY